MNVSEAAVIGLIGEWRALQASVERLIANQQLLWGSAEQVTEAFSRWASANYESEKYFSELADRVANLQAIIALLRRQGVK